MRVCTDSVACCYDESPRTFCYDILHDLIDCDWLTVLYLIEYVQSEEVLWERESFIVFHVLNNNSNMCDLCKVYNREHGTASQCWHCCLRWGNLIKKGWFWKRLMYYINIVCVSELHKVCHYPKILISVLTRLIFI